MQDLPEPPPPAKGMSSRAMSARRTAVVVGCLLVVGGVVIATVLAVRARTRERTETCINNQQQIIMMALLYADDWDGVLPDVGSYPGGACWGDTWTEAAQRWDAYDAPIVDYIKGAADLYKCPLVDSLPSPSYAWNRHLSSYLEPMIRYPSTTPVTWDWVPGRLTAPGIPLDLDAKRPFWPSGSGLPIREDMNAAVTRHGGGLIVGFMDGHAALIRPTRWTPQTPDGNFMPSDDKALPWPPKEYQGRVISMYPQDPMAADPRGEER
jgi:prepilin-type processing-associated H-X9-DG protein